MPVTSGTVTSGTPAETVIVTVLPNATGPSPGPGVTAMTSPTSTAALRPSSPFLTTKPSASRLAVGLLRALPGDVGDGDRLVALADDDRDDLVALEVGAGRRVETDTAPAGDAVSSNCSAVVNWTAGRVACSFGSTSVQGLPTSARVDPEALRALDTTSRTSVPRMASPALRVGRHDRARGELLAPLLVAAVGVQPGAPAAGRWRRTAPGRRARAPASSGPSRATSRWRRW